MPEHFRDLSLFVEHIPEVGIPRQGNGSDCGIFALKFLKHLWAGKTSSFKAKDVAESELDRIASEF
ncbi:hypothetical protein ACOSP7_004751 [Xanthoceras sorbifolium]